MTHAMEAQANASKSIPTSDRGNMALAWFWAIIWNVFAIPTAFALPRAGREDPIFYGFVIFPILGAVLLFRAARVTSQYLKFGNATFNMLPESGVGGTVAGFIVASTKVQGAKKFRLVLRCIQRVTTGSRNNRVTEERVLWEDWRDVRELGEDSRQSGIPVCFEIPSSCSTTNPAQGISWKLEVSADVPGMNFSTTFDIPVHGATSGVSRKAVEQFEQQHGVATDMAEILARAGIYVRSHGNGLEVRAGAARHKIMAVIAALCFGMFVAGFVNFVKRPASIENLFPAGILGIFMLCFWWIATILCGVSSCIRTEDDTLHFTKRWFGVPRRQTVSRASICSLATDFGMSAGYTTYYDLVLMTNAGKKTTLIHNIRGQREAYWLASELRSYLRIR